MYLWNRQIFVYIRTTVKPLMFACPLVCKLNKTAKLKGAYTNAIPTLIGIVCCVWIVWSEFAKIKGAKIILHVKLPSFMAAKLKGFTLWKVLIRNYFPTTTTTSTTTTTVLWHHQLRIGGFCWSEVLLPTVLLLKASGTFGFRRRCLNSQHWCYLHCLHTWQFSYKFHFMEKLCGHFAINMWLWLNCRYVSWWRKISVLCPSS